MGLLILLHEGLTIKKIPIDKQEIRIGRNTDSDIFIDDLMASKNHAKILKQDSPNENVDFDYYIEDLQSTNHTYVNDKEISRKKLVHEDRIRIGRHLFKFIDETAAQADRTTKLHKSWIPGVYYTKE